MTSSPLIRLQRPLAPSSDKISKNENRTLVTVFHQLFKNIFFDFRFQNLFTSGQTFQPVTSGKLKIGQRFFDILLVMIKT